MGSISVTMFSDAACPWAYSVSPSLRVLEWRYGEQLAWRLVL
jgi:predicted DsbA family dithiol-disulfide isomerase